MMKTFPELKGWNRDLQRSGITRLGLCVFSHTFPNGNSTQLRSGQKKRQPAKKIQGLKLPRLGIKSRPLIQKMIHFWLARK